MRLIQDGPRDVNCCVCGGRSELTYCIWCGHVFCGRCRKQSWYRTKAALKEFFLGDPPRYCSHD